MAARCSSANTRPLVGELPLLSLSDGKSKCYRRTFSLPVRVVASDFLGAKSSFLILPGEVISCHAPKLQRSFGNCETHEARKGGGGNTSAGPTPPSPAPRQVNGVNCRPRHRSR